MAQLDDSPERRDPEGEAAFDNSVEAGADLNGQSINFLKITQLADQQNQQFLAAIQRAAWINAHRAYRNQHVSNSKYATAPYRKRSQMFRPKVRAAVRKALATCAAAYFSTADVLSVKAEYDDDPIRQVSAKVLEHLVNYRLDRTSARSGVPWFLMCMGAALDGQLHGVMASKQYWDYQVVTEEHQVEPYQSPQTNDDGSPMIEAVLDAAGQPSLDPTTGQPSVQPVMQTVSRETREYVTHDRPMVMLIPPEHVMVDPSAPWYDPAQLSPHLIVKYPMTVDDAKTMLRSPDKGGNIQWLDVPDAVFDQAQTDYTNKGVRVERSGGIDRYDNRDTAGAAQRLRIVWMYENFVRIDGADYHYWSIGNRAYASKVQPTRASYPEQFGNRPYTYGYSAIESHNIAPMSPVEQILPLQYEANELVNLRLDLTKQALSPIAKVRQGSLFDWKQLQHRGSADTTIIVRDPKDLEFEKTPTPGADSYQEMDRINNDIDELSGSFSSSSIQANRQLNETVGGLRLLNGASNATNEFDLRVFNQTWAEPTIRQVVRLEQYYEDDETILEIAGARAASMFQRHGVDAITDKDLEHEVSCRIDVGIGAADPMQRLQKLGMGFQMIGQAAPFLDKKVTLKAEELIPEVMGAIGYADGMRFFTLEDQGGQPPPEMMLEMLKLQLEQSKLDMNKLIADGSNQNRIQVTELQGRFTIISDIVAGLVKTRQDAHQRQHEQQLGFDNFMGSLATGHMQGANAERVAKARGSGASKSAGGGR